MNLSLNGGSVFCPTDNGFFRWLPTHHDGRLDPAHLTKSPSCNCRGCSLPACLLCRTCGGCCRHTLCQTAETDRGEDEGGDGCWEDKDRLNRDAGVYHVSCDRAVSPMKSKAAGQDGSAAERLSHLRNLDHKHCDMAAVVLSSRGLVRKVKTGAPRSHSRSCTLIHPERWSLNEWNLHLCGYTEPGLLVRVSKTNKIVDYSVSHVATTYKLLLHSQLLLSTEMKGLRQRTRHNYV